MIKIQIGQILIKLPSSYNNVTACQMYGDNVENKIIIQFAGNHGRVQVKKLY